MTYDDRRGSASDRGYDAAWQRASKAHLDDSPICRYCEVGAFGRARIAEATLVDHLYPHRGDRQLFWARHWWVSSCTTCHSGPKQRVETAGTPAIHRLAILLGLKPRNG